jgi:hypothetical protein
MPKEKRRRLATRKDLDQLTEGGREKVEETGRRAESISRLRQRPACGPPKGRGRSGRAGVSENGAAGFETALAGTSDDGAWDEKARSRLAMASKRH